MTTIVIFAIPLSVLITLTVLYFVGWSLNLITMMGLMISVGMVVDNSIVVLENIYRKRHEGQSDQRAALTGTSEVALAVTLATLTTVVVFLPLILMNDNVGFQFFMLRIGLPVIVALLASLFVSMVFIPLAATYIVSRRKVEEPRTIVRTNRYYQKVLNWAISHRIEMSVVLILALASMQFASSNSKEGESRGNINDFRLWFEMPDNFTMEDAEQLFQAAEDTIMVKSDVYGIKTILAHHSHNWGQLRVFYLNQKKKNGFRRPVRIYWNTPGFMKERS